MINVTLRPYQADLVSSVIKSIDVGNKDILVIAPTSAGKTLAFVALAEELVANCDDEVVLILSHLGLLTEQTSKKFARFSELKVGTLQADKVPDNDAKVVIGTMQSVSDFYKASHIATMMDKKVKAIIVDESHRRHSQSYTNIFNFFPDSPVIDFTATPFKNKKLATNIYDDIAYQISLQELIDQKYIVPPILRQIPFDQDEAEKRAAIMLRTYIEYELGKSAICFMRTKNECKMLSDAFNNAGIDACAVTADVTGSKRDDIFERYSRGEIKVLVSVEVLSAGFDAPICEVAFMLGTENPTTYIQRVGRTLRPQDALSVKPEHAKQNARIYVFGPTPVIESGEYEKHHNQVIKPKKKQECKDNEDLLEWLKDNEVTDTVEYHHIKEAVRVAKIAKKLNMSLIATMINDTGIDPQFLGKLANALGNSKAKDKPATVELRKALIKATVNNESIHIEDYSKVNEGEAKALIKAITGSDYRQAGFKEEHYLKDGVHAGKHVKDIPWAYKQIILKKAPGSDIARAIRSFHKSLSQPK